MSVTNLSQYSGKKVVVVVNLTEPNEKGELAVELQGQATAANEMGLILKPKGRAQATIIEAKNIESIDYLPEKPTPLKTKWIPDLEFGKARQHLVTYHGFEVSKIEPMDEGEALKWHNSTLDHSDLGHRHGEKPKAEKPAAASQETTTE